MKRESELDSFKWLSPQALFLYLCCFTRCWQSFSHIFHIFLKVKVFGILIFNSESFWKYFSLINSFCSKDWRSQHVKEFLWRIWSFNFMVYFHLQYCGWLTYNWLTYDLASIVTIRIVDPIHQSLQLELLTQYTTHYN